MKSPVFAGVDVSRRTLDTALEGDTQVRQIDNRLAPIRRWLHSLPEGCAIGVESTGNLHQLLVRTAIAAGRTVYVLNARDLAHYARALGRRAKTDRLDAQLILRYLQREHEHLHPYHLPSARQTEIAELIGRRHRVVKAQGALQQSFTSSSHRPRALGRTLRAFEALIAELDARLQALVAEEDTLHSAATHLRTMVGFGPLLSASMAHAVKRHPFKNADAFIAYIGYDPRVRDSGQWRGRRFLSKRGPAELRRLLFTAAMSACKTKLWQPFYQRYRARGLSTTAALVVLARKLARIAFSIVRHNVDFRPELVKVPCAQP
ncbi:MAG TPA: transposase [Burkholderiales bacterium]|jgi:transposase|nr:transposase [Burkholderiales bacterium]